MSPKLTAFAFLFRVLLLACILGSPRAALAGFVDWQNQVNSGSPTVTRFTSVSGAAPVSLNVGSFAAGSARSFEFVFNAAGAGPSKSLLGSEDAASGRQYLKINQWNNTGKFGLTTAGVADDVFANSPTISNQQVHAVFTSNGSVTTLYLNGVAQTGTINRGLTITGTNGLAAFDNSSHTSYTDSLDGTILGFASYARALTPAEITARFNALNVVVPGLGSDLINRANNDGATGQLYLYDTPTTTSGKAHLFQFFDNESGTRWITPLVFEKSGNTYFLRGVGTSRNTTGAGLQSYPFDLIAGSSDMGPNHTFGFIDSLVTVSGGVLQRSNINNAGGSVDWDYAAPTQWRFSTGIGTFALGHGFYVGNELYPTETRTYSARMTINRAPTALSFSGSSIPENPFTGGYPTGTLGASDPDGDTLTYSLVSGYGDNATFSISGTSLLLNGATDFETKSSYFVLVRGTDPAGNTLDQAFTISVRNGNETPSFTKGANQTHAFNTTGTQTVANWATAINDGDSTVNQALTFNVSVVSNTGITFAAPPCDIRERNVDL